MKKVTILAGLAMLSLTAAASAQRDGIRDGRNAEVSRQQMVERATRRFDRLDADHDGRLTAQEARQARGQFRGQMGGRAFDRLDLDRNGNITRVEFDQARQQRAGRLAERGQTGDGGPGRARSMRRAHGVQAMRAREMFRDQGFITREQFERRAMARFDRLDRDGNGLVSLAERREGREFRRADRRERSQ